MARGRGRTRGVQRTTARCTYGALRTTNRGVKREARGQISRGAGYYCACARGAATTTLHRSRHHTTPHAHAPPPRHPDPTSGKRQAPSGIAGPMALVIAHPCSKREARSAAPPRQRWVAVAGGAFYSRFARRLLASCAPFTLVCASCALRVRSVCAPCALCVRSVAVRCRLHQGSFGLHPQHTTSEANPGQGGNSRLCLV